MAINFEPTIQTHTVASIFTKHIAKVIPLAFDESMSYYECICAFRDYLNTVIIPNVNNVNDAVAELQSLYLDLQDAVNQEIERFETDITTDFNNLHDFVDNYFENNFPALVSSTLDEMSEDGTLENLLNDAAHLTKSYDTYTDMIADSSTFTNGLRLKTLGYYSVNDGGEAEYYVNNSVVSTNYQIDLENGLYLNLITNNELNIKKIGAYGDNTHEDGTIFTNALNICKQCNINTLYIPSGQYKISTNLLIDFPLNIKGDYCEFTGDYNNEILGTLLIDNYDGNEPFIKYSDDVSTYPESRLWGIKINDIQIKSNIHTHMGLYLRETGWNGLLSNVYFRGFYNTALFLDRVYDTKFDNIQIIECGSKTSSEQNYALVVDDTSNADSSNALHFDSMHIEGCRYSLKLNRSKNNTFANCKFEDKMNSSESDTTNSEILITDNASENSFIGCQFIGIGAKTWTDNNIAIASAPYMIDIKFSANRLKSILFDSCQFSSPNDRGTKFIKSANYTQISNCAFRFCCNKYYTLDLVGAQLINSSFILNNSESGIANVSIIKAGNINLIDNCRFQYFGSTTTSRYAIDLDVNTSSINNCQYTDFTGNYKYTDQSSINFNMSYQQRNSGMLNLSDTNYKNLMGLSEIDFTNIVLDASKFTNKLVSLAFSQDATIKEIKNGLNGDEITFINNTAHTFTFGGSFDYNGTKIRGSADTSTISIGNLGSCSISKFTNYWKVISKN